MIGFKDIVASASSKSFDNQFIRYALVGAFNNIRGYLIYLLITSYWLEPKVAVSLMYPIGAGIAYFGHARYSFAYKGATTPGVARYVIAHTLGYVSNIGILYFLSDQLGWPHQVVQVMAIFLVAGILFFLFRYFVFRGTNQFPEALNDQMPLLHHEDQQR